MSGLDLSHRQRSAWLPRLQLAKPGPQVQLLGCAQRPEIARALFRSLMKPMRCLAEGGVNGVAFISSPLLPAARHGTKFDGLAHLSDIYLTVAVGIAQLSIDIAATGPIPPDSHNLWPALMSGAPSPRPEVVHLPLSAGNMYGINTSDCGRGCGTPTSTGCHGCAPSIRQGDWKLLVGWPGDDQLVALPPDNESIVPCECKRVGRDGCSRLNS